MTDYLHRYEFPALPPEHPQPHAFLVYAPTGDGDPLVDGWDASDGDRAVPPAAVAATLQAQCRRYLDGVGYPLPVEGVPAYEHRALEKLLPDPVADPPPGG